MQIYTCYQGIGSLFGAFCFVVFAFVEKIYLLTFTCIISFKSLISGTSFYAAEGGHIVIGLSVCDTLRLGFEKCS